MRRPSRTELSWIVLLLASISTTAQQLDKIGSQKPLAFAGGISINHTLYAAKGTTSGRDTHNTLASGHASMSLYGWVLPFSFSVSSQQKAFTQPFNRFTVQPKWKWITVHAGFTSMSFSPHTVNGHIFQGVGVDLDRGEKWRVSALSGRFAKAVDSDSLRNIPPVLKRTGQALRMRYGTNVSYSEIILFHARDISNGVDTLTVKPRRNLAASLRGSAKLLPRLRMTAEMANSIMTRNSDAEKRQGQLLLARMFSFPETRSTAAYQALNASLEWQEKDYTIGLAYQRIDPGYETLGAYHFNNDLENVALNGSGRLLDNKLSLAASAGTQRDNIDGKKTSSMRRIVSSFNAQYSPSDRLNLSASYNGFKTVTNLQPLWESVNAIAPVDPDTLNYRQISRSATVSALFTSGRKQTLSLQGSFQQTAEWQGSSIRTDFFTMLGSYTLALIPANLSLSVIMTMSQQVTSNHTSRMGGPTASISKLSWRKRLRSTLSSSMNTTITEGAGRTRGITTRSSSVFVLGDQHRVNLSIALSRRTYAKEGLPAASEVIAAITYQYSFTPRPP